MRLLNVEQHFVKFPVHDFQFELSFKVIEIIRIFIGYGVNKTQGQMVGDGGGGGGRRLLVRPNEPEPDHT